MAMVLEKYNTPPPLIVSFDIPSIPSRFGCIGLRPMTELPYTSSDKKRAIRSDIWRLEPPFSDTSSH